MFPSLSRAHSSACILIHFPLCSHCSDSVYESSFTRYGRKSVYDVLGWNCTVSNYIRFRRDLSCIAPSISLCTYTLTIPRSFKIIRSGGVWTCPYTLESVSTLNWASEFMTITCDTTLFSCRVVCSPFRGCLNSGENRILSKGLYS